MTRVISKAVCLVASTVFLLVVDWDYWKVALMAERTEGDLAEWKAVALGGNSAAWRDKY